MYSLILVLYTVSWVSHYAAATSQTIGHYSSLAECNKAAEITNQNPPRVSEFDAKTICVASNIATGEQR